MECKYCENEAAALVWDWDLGYIYVCLDCLCIYSHRDDAHDVDILPEGYTDYAI